MSSEEYLWNKKGPVDPEIEHLERELGELRFRGELPEPGWLEEGSAEHGHGRGGRRYEPILSPRVIPMLLGAAAALVLGLYLWRTLLPRKELVPHTVEVAQSPYRVELLQGSCQAIGGREVDAGTSLLPGQKLVLGPDARARITVGDIGAVELEPLTTIRVEQPGSLDDDSEYLLFLERGTLTASIFAAPRIFQMGTPAGIAVDLGCVYTATVEEDGSARLRVDSGLVSFESDGRRAVVPAGAYTVATPGRGPRTPVWEDTEPGYVAALCSLDGSGPPVEGDLAIVLATEREQDSLPLWHLLEHESARVRSAVSGKLVTLAPAPEGVTPMGCNAGDGEMIELWKESMPWMDWNLKKLGPLKEPERP